MCVDDNDLLAEVLERWIDGHTEFSWAGRLEDPHRLKEIEPDAQPDVVLMDLSMPGIDTLRAIRESTAARPTLKIVMLSGRMGAREIKAALDAGARGFLTKDQPVIEILEGIRRANAGEVVLSQEARLSLAGFEAQPDGVSRRP